MIIKLATFRGTSPQGEPLNWLFQPDGMTKVAGTIMPDVTRWLSSYKGSNNELCVLVNAMGSSEYWGQNINGDIFYEDALVHDCRNHPSQQHGYDDFTGKIIPPYGYWTFLTAFPFVHHKNKDPSRAFGRVALAVWNPRMHRVELIVILDKRLAMEHGAQSVVDRILAGEFPDVSMGCKVPYDVCAVCGNKSKTRNDYCACVKHIGMGKILDDGRRIGVINPYPRFFDISFVFIGADKTAKVMAKLASAGLPQSVVEADMIYDCKAACGAKDCRECNSCKVKAASLADAMMKLRVGPGRYVSKKQLIEMAEDAAAANSGKDSELREHKSVFTPRTVPAPDPTEAGLLMGKIDNQENPQGIRSDGLLRTNYSRAEEEKLSSGVEGVFSKAKEMKIGPPPDRNRKEFPFVGTIDFRGLKIHVENRPGDVREGTGAGGKKWRTEMKLAYGEILGTKGVDGDKVDVYVGPYTDAPNVYIIHQQHTEGAKKGKYDEDKVMLGLRSPEEAKAAYLAHYDSPDYFRSITIMAFPLFRRIIKGSEASEEKIATTLQKVAAEMHLEDLFEGASTARRRQRMWRDEVTGKEKRVTGSGLNKEASAKPLPEPPGPRELLKMAADAKIASQSKWAEIIKRIGPSKAVGRVGPVLSDAEPELPADMLEELGHSPDLQKVLATSSLMGMVLKPREFQHLALSNLGHDGLARELDAGGVEFKPTDKEVAPCAPLSPLHMSPDIMKALMPYLEDKSYLGPVVGRRIARIIVIQTEPKEAPTKVDSPLLSKVSGAYNWYRREMMKVAAETPFVVPSLPELYARVYDLGPSDLFKSAEGIDRRSAALILGSIPLTLMYSAHQKEKSDKGKENGPLDSLLAEHPWLSAIGVAAGIRELLKTPKGQEIADRIFETAQALRQKVRA